MKHTKEPWIIADDDVFVEVMAGTKTVLPAIRKADAAEDFRRIVACVNACAGAATDDLEKHGFLAMRTRQVVALEAQRDELLAALGKIASPTQSDGLLWWQIEAREALAKVGAGRAAPEGRNAEVSGAGTASAGLPGSAAT